MATSRSETEFIPFVPGYSLLDAESQELTQEQVAAIGCFLLEMLPPPAKESAWTLASRLEGVSNRL